MTTVLICDDRGAVRDGLARVMWRVSGVERVEVVDHSALLARYTRVRRDLVLVGTQRSSTRGVDTVRSLLAGHRYANVIAVGAPEDVGAIAAAIAVGARGFLRWDADSPPQMVAAVTHVVASTAVLQAVDRGGGDDGLGLTQRQMQVLHGMSTGLSNSEIGRTLFLTEDTVKTHARQLFRKLGVGDRAQAVAHGFRRSLIS